MTTLELSGPDSDLHLKLLSKLSKRERRALIRTFLVQIKPWLRHFTRAAIDHADDGLIRRRRATQRGISVPDCEKITSLSGIVGYEIRKNRLKLGISQSEVAHRLGMHRTHLSDLERGVHLPNSRTRTALDREFSAGVSAE